VHEGRGSLVLVKGNLGRNRDGGALRSSVRKFLGELEAHEILQ